MEIKTDKKYFQHGFNDDTWILISIVFKQGMEIWNDTKTTNRWQQVRVLMIQSFI